MWRCLWRICSFWVVGGSCCSLIISYLQFGWTDTMGNYRLCSCWQGWRGEICRPLQSIYKSVPIWFNLYSLHYSRIMCMSFIPFVSQEQHSETSSISLPMIYSWVVLFCLSISRDYYYYEPNPPDFPVLWQKTKVGRVQT
jgi:hypothetical protein